jgi:DNA polymerase III delta prime subunit
MQNIENHSIYKNLLLEKNNLFSFYLIFGNIEENKKIVKEFLKKDFGTRIKKNQDFLEYDFDIFKIDDARKISKLQLSKNISKDGEKNQQFFLITAKDINIYTQNTLLKTLEEPAENTFFFLFLENDFKILKTLLSRARVLKENNNKFSETFLKIVGSDFKEREVIIKEIENTRDKISLVSEFEAYFLENKNIFLDRKNSFAFSKKEFLEFYKILLKLKKMAQTEGMNITNIIIFLDIKFPKVKKILKS